MYVTCEAYTETDSVELGGCINLASWLVQSSVNHLLQIGHLTKPVEREM